MKQYIVDAFTKEVFKGNPAAVCVMETWPTEEFMMNVAVGKELVENVIKSMYSLGIIKVALVVFDKNEVGNAFWEKQGFTVRNDLIYRNKSLTEIERIDT